MRLISLVYWLRDILVSINICLLLVTIIINTDIDIYIYTETVIVCFKFYSPMFLVRSYVLTVMNNKLITAHQE